MGFRFSFLVRCLCLSLSVVAVFLSETAFSQSTVQFPNLEHFEGMVLASDVNRDGIDDVVNATSFFDSQNNRYETRIYHYLGGAPSPVFLTPMTDPSQPSQLYYYSINGILLDKPVIEGGFLYMLISDFRTPHAFLEVLEVQANGTYQWVRSFQLSPRSSVGEIKTAKVFPLGYDVDHNSQYPGKDVVVAWGEIDANRGSGQDPNSPGAVSISIASPHKNPYTDPNQIILPNSRSVEPNCIVDFFKTYRVDDPTKNMFFTLGLTSDSLGNPFVGATFYQLEFDPQNDYFKPLQAVDRMRVPGPNVRASIFHAFYPRWVALPKVGMTWGEFYFIHPTHPGAPLLQFSRYMSGLSLGLTSVAQGQGNFTFIDPNQIAIGEIIDTDANDLFLSDGTRDINGDGFEEVVFVGGQNFASRIQDIDSPFLVFGTPQGQAPFLRGFDYSRIGAGVHDGTWGDFKGDGTADDFVVSLARSSDLTIKGRISFWEGIQINGHGDIIRWY